MTIGYGKYEIGRKINLANAISSSLTVPMLLLLFRFLGLNPFDVKSNSVVKIHEGSLLLAPYDLQLSLLTTELLADQALFYMFLTSS